MDTKQPTTDTILHNCIPEDWKAAKIRDLELKKGGSELFWMNGKEDGKDLLMPRPLAWVEIPTIAEELVRRWNAFQELRDSLKTLLPLAEDHNDRGPVGSGWQSDELSSNIAKAKALLQTLKD